MVYFKATTSKLNPYYTNTDQLYVIMRGCDNRNDSSIFTQMLVPQTPFFPV